jgi:hypothetical protein
VGYALVYQLAYGAVSAMAVVISVTFLWLWWARATPLALGMAFSWAGAGLVMGWWWVFNLRGGPEGMVQHPVLFVFVAAYLVGAALHFQVIQRTVGAPHALFWAFPGAALAFVVALAIFLA